MASDSIYGPGISDEKDWALEMGWDGESAPPDGIPEDSVLFGMTEEGNDE